MGRFSLRIRRLFLFVGVLTAIAPASYGQAGDLELLATVVRAERDHAGLSNRDKLCLVVTGEATTSKKLLAELKSDGLRIQRASSCMFRGYQIAIETSSAGSLANIHAKVVDLRYRDTDLAIIIRDGTYSVEKSTGGKWQIRKYDPVSTQNISETCPTP